MAEMYTLEQVIFKLRCIIRDEGGIRGAARKLGVSRQMIADISCGIRKPGPKTLAGMGIKRTLVVWYSPLIK